MPKLPLLTSLRPLLVVCAAVAASLAAAPVAAAKPIPAVPQGFVGMMVDGPIFPDAENHVDLGKQLDVMVQSGVESLRVVFDWARAQPYAGWGDVPAGQAKDFVDVASIPTRFAELDKIVGLAARRGLTVLPVVENSPGWDADQLSGAAEANPRSVYWYAQFVKALVERYGPHGTFWETHAPKVPITMWQIWNEPNIPAFWPVQPFEQSYVYMLSAAHAAIKSADPNAKVVLAGMPNFSWQDLAKIYKVPGARALFDVVAVHPYTKNPRGVITILHYVRGVMNGHGDWRKPMLADEVSWPSSAGKTSHNAGLDFTSNEAQQARNIGALLPMLARSRASLRLSAFYYYTWAGRERRNSLPFEFAGLFRFSGNRFFAKPAFATFTHTALSLEHCRVKRTRATRCG